MTTFADDCEPGDVIQVNPSSELGRTWGPQLCIVSQQSDWGVRAYFVHAHMRGSFGSAFLHLPRGSYERVGRAVWVTER